MATVRFGLLGTARVNRHLIPAIRAVSRAELVAVASRDGDRAAQYAAEWGIPRAIVSYEALLADPGIDAIYLSLPNSLHAPWTAHAIEAGKHVLVEKPLALDPAGIDRLAEAAAARRVRVCEGFMYRHEPLTARVRQLVAEDAVGPLRLVSSGFVYQQARDGDVRLDPKLGGGSLWDVGCYAVSYARLIAGCEPEEVFGWKTVGPTGTDDTFTGMLRFPADLVAMVHSSFRATPRTWLVLQGVDGTLRVANPFKPGPREAIELQRGDQVQRIEVEGSERLFVREVADFVATVLDDRPPVISLDDSRGNAAALRALHDSAAAARPIALPDTEAQRHGSTESSHFSRESEK